MINAAIIINPTAGKGRGLKLIEELKNFKIPSAVNLSIFITEYPLHATEISKNISRNFDRIIIAGGDGTLNEFTNGFDLENEVLLGLLPIGSGNDFSLSLNKEPADIPNYLKYFLTDNPDTLKIDLGALELIDAEGKIHKRWFINSLGIGFDARVAYLNQTNKILSGSMSYYVAIFRAFLRFNSIDFHLNLDGKSFNKTALFCSIGNGESVGAGLYLMPGARISDGLLDLSIVNLKSRLKLIKLLPKAIKNQLRELPELEQMRFHELEIELQTPYYTHVDGEIVSSSCKKVKVKVLDKAIRFMILDI